MLRAKLLPLGNTSFLNRNNAKSHPNGARFVVYRSTISTRRFCGSRTFGPVGTSGREKP